MGIAIKDLTVTYDRHPAVHHLSAVLEAGSLTSVIAPNGSGKTTLLETIAGIRKPNEGSITLQGFCPGAGRNTIITTMITSNRCDH